MQQTNAPIEYWNAIASLADGTKLVAAANPSGFGITTPGPIYTSSDSGVTWVSNNVPGKFGRRSPLQRTAAILWPVLRKEQPRPMVTPPLTKLSLQRRIRG